MADYNEQDLRFFRNAAGKIQYNPICRQCRNRCKQSYRAELVYCRRFCARKPVGKSSIVNTEK